MFNIKICGVREVCEIEAVFKSGADAIGLNFYSPSCRFIDPENPVAAKLAGKAGELGLTRIGVFVNASLAAMVQAAESLKLEAVQLHGDEQTGVVSQLRDEGVPKLIRAIKLPVGPLTIHTIEERLDAWACLGIHLLLDADGGHSHGGTGKTLDWDTIRQWADQRGDVSWTLAGGLNPENIAGAIVKSGASSVDTASGVEAERGTKSVPLISQFSKNALAAFQMP